MLIYMNQPLRYAGKTFYQASFGKNDTLSILQVVANPGWLLPYISCVLVTLGLLVHFGISLSRWLRRQAARNAAGNHRPPRRPDMNPRRKIAVAPWAAGARGARPHRRSALAPRAAP